MQIYNPVIWSPFLLSMRSTWSSLYWPTLWGNSLFISWNLPHGTYPSYCLMSIVLQLFDKAVNSAGSDIWLTLNRRMSIWEERKYYLLVGEATRCDRRIVHPRGRRRASTSDDHVAKVFTRLMLQDKIRAAMRWLTDNSKRSLLQPSDKVRISIDGQETQINVIEKKHPSPQLPHSMALSPLDNLPNLEDLELKQKRRGAT